MTNTTRRRRLQTAEECKGGGIDLSEECQRAAECAVGMSAACIIDSDCESTAPPTAAVVLETAIEVSRSEAEQRAAELFAVSPPVGMLAPPTLEQMLVPGSEASVMLATMFTTEQQPHLAFPTAIEHVGASSGGPGGGGGNRRQLQRADGGADRVVITVKAVAPTPEEADGAIARLQALGTSGR